MDPTDKEQENRRRRLREWVYDHGGHAQVVRDRKLTPSQASYLSQVVNGYSFASRAARHMEKRLGMPEGWLDVGVSDVKAAASRSIADELVDTILALPPSRWVSVRAQLEQLVAHPQMRDEVLAELRMLLAVPRLPRSVPRGLTETQDFAGKPPAPDSDDRHDPNRPSAAPQRNSSR